MTVQAYQFAGGYGVVAVPNASITSPRSPTTTDTITPDGNPYTPGQYWLNSVTSTLYVYIGNGIWDAVSGSGITPITELTADTGTATPTAGAIDLAGTANEITTAASGSTVTFSIPTAFIAPGSIASTTTITSGTAMVATTTVTAGTGITSTTGNIVATAGNINATAGSISAGTSITAGTTLTATLGNITATNGNLALNTAGNKLVIHATTAANDSVGTTAAMTGTPGAITTATTACTTASKIIYARATTGGTPGEVSITAQSAGSFTLTSTGNETSTFNYLIIN